MACIKKSNGQNANTTGSATPSAPVCGTPATAPYSYTAPTQYFFDSTYCTNPDKQCGQNIVVQDENSPPSQKSLFVYRSVVLDKSNINNNIKQAIIVIHGLPGNAKDMFKFVTDATSHNSQIAIIAPYLGGEDANLLPTLVPTSPTSPSLIHWTKEKYWAGGIRDPALPSILTSFDALDQLVDIVVGTFPKLTQLTIAGFSAGGQTVQHYAAFTNIDTIYPKTPIRYLVASPSSYLYFTPDRVANTCDTYFIPNQQPPNTCYSQNIEPSFTSPQWKTCNKICDKNLVKDWDNYKFGLSDITTTAPYLSKGRSNADIGLNFLSKNVTYLINTGDQTTTPLTYNGCSAAPTLDCASTLQGPNSFNTSNSSNRMQRGLIYASYLKWLIAKNYKNLTPNHKFYIYNGLKDNCGHNEMCFYGAPLSQDSPNNFPTGFLMPTPSKDGPIFLTGYPNFTGLTESTLVYDLSK